MLQSSLQSRDALGPVRRWLGTEWDCFIEAIPRWDGGERLISVRNHCSAFPFPAENQPKKKYVHKKYTYRGIQLEELLDKSGQELMELFNARQRRRLSRGLDIKVSRDGLYQRCRLFARGVESFGLVAVCMRVCMCERAHCAAWLSRAKLVSCGCVQRFFSIPRSIVSSYT